MIINKINFNNLGVFHGKHELCLRPENENKPITLLGGLNGAGKTTVFNAIKLCLYGPNIVKNNGNGSYLKYLKSRIHKSKDLVVQPNHASIGIEFQYAQNGKINVYDVERAWELKRTKVVETLTVKKDGQNIDEIEKENWQQFIKELIPMGLSRLFFFDGEKIQKMMSDDNNEELKASIKALIGLDLVERLNADLKIYKRKFLVDKSDELSAKQFEDLEKDKDKYQREISKLKNLRAELRNRVLVAKKKLDTCESKITAQGGWYFKNREKLQTKKIEAEKDIEVIKEKIRELCAGLLPVSIAADLGVKLKQQVRLDEQIKNTQVETRILAEKLKELNNTINDKNLLSNIAGLDRKTKTQIKNEFKQAINSYFLDSGEDTTEKTVFGFSDSQASDILRDIEDSQQNIPEKLKQYTKQFEAKYREVQRTIVNLNRAPDEDDMKSIHEKRNILLKDLGALENEDKHLGDKIDMLINKYNEITRRTEILETRETEKLKRNEKVRLLNETEKVLGIFYRELAKLKSQKLTAEFTGIFNKLHRKKDMLDRIEINPKDFGIALYDKNNKKINKSSLSSGELEIFAMSMVWALAKISGQNLPFIIDTPLGRLDSHHRENLLKTFFPQASHQMVIFSTDTEVDRHNFNILEPSVSQSYMFEHDDQEKVTIINKGYFG